MIECDSCKDWFHGSCVGVSRQQGRKLEKQKKEWKCPNCLTKEGKSFENFKISEIYFLFGIQEKNFGIQKLFLNSVYSFWKSFIV